MQCHFRQLGSLIKSFVFVRSPSCRSNVFANKMACYRCGTPKPAGGGTSGTPQSR